MARAQLEAQLENLAEFEPSSNMAWFFKSRGRTHFQNSSRARAEFELQNKIFELRPASPNSVWLGSNTALVDID